MGRHLTDSGLKMENNARVDKRSLNVTTCVTFVWAKNTTRLHAQHLPACQAAKRSDNRSAREG